MILGSEKGAAAKALKAAEQPSLGAGVSGCAQLIQLCSPSALLCPWAGRGNTMLQPEQGHWIVGLLQFRRLGSK